MRAESASASSTAHRAVTAGGLRAAASGGRAGALSGCLPEVRWAVIFDGVAAILAYVLVLILRSEVGEARFLGRFAFAVDWTMLILLGVLFVTLNLFGLYEREVFVSRRVHLWALLKAIIWALLVTVAIVYLSGLHIAFGSRFVVVGTFVVFFALVLGLRIVGISSIVAARLMDRPAPTLVVGDPRRTENLQARLIDLKGFTDLSVLPLKGGDRALVERLSAALDQAGVAGAAGATRFAHVFIDAASMAPKTALDLAARARSAGADVYVVSDLLRSLSCRSLLSDLFQAPVVRLRGGEEGRLRRVAQRALDIVGAVVALVLLAPLMAAIALAVKLTSPGPVLFAQERIGRHGRPFTFYKFRSMVADSTAEPHREFVHEFINGKGGLRQTFAVGDDAPYKLADDPRVTRVGRFLRKYSLDELPQFWNVLVGDMSLVGPRPALPYEVDEYRDWHRRRLALLPGVSGLWQIDGRSRVSFDEMVFQDVMYGYARSVLVDVMICLRTLPAALMGRGAK